MEAEGWGIFPEFSHSRDAISALCMFKWTFLRAADAADVLGVDAKEAKHWRSLATQFVDYPVYDTGEEEFGIVFATLPDIRPTWKRGDHPWFIGVYPTVLADEITLDSPAELREQMLRTARVAPATPNKEVYVLLGACPEHVASVSGRPEILRGDDLPLLRREVDAHPERLLNSRSGRIHLFPCVPADANIAFRRFQARGAFLVSASRTNEGVVVVEIEARRNGECRVVNPWTGSKTVVLSETKTGKNRKIRVKDDEIRFFAEAGKTYILRKI